MAIRTDHAIQRLAGAVDMVEGDAPTPAQWLKIKELIHEGLADIVTRKMLDEYRPEYVSSIKDSLRLIATDHSKNLLGAYSGVAMETSAV